MRLFALIVQLSVSFLFEITITVKISCNQSDNTGKIWNKIFKKISTKVENYEPNIHLSETDDINPSYIIEELKDLHKPTLIVIDEFDNIKKASLKLKLLIP